ncbi:hypothetical protein KAS14_00170 [Candidatus Bathyarchaeota archaeon]|jgi:hypothetical protein|nr:hypothetical protein [Candidatus Bathyarchaeota archaeon]
MVDAEMLYQDYSQQIDESEKVLQKIAQDISSGIISEILPPRNLWDKIETSIFLLKELAENVKEVTLIMKPEKTAVIEQLFEATTQPLNTFKETLFRESKDPLNNSRLALVELRKAMTGGSDFLDLAKEIRDKPSPLIQDILLLKEVYATKEYLATVQAPETFQVRLNSLIEHMKALSTSLTSLESALDSVKECLGNFREESLKIRSTPTEPFPKLSEEVSVTGTKSDSARA